MQPAFTARLLRGAKALGLHTALDTSGFLGAHCTDAMLDDLDLVLLDVKSGLPDTYRRTTGRELAPTLDFGRRLNDRGIAIWVRFVLVPGPDGRARRTSPRSPTTSSRSVAPSVSRCCRSTRWAATSGPSWAWSTSSRRRLPPTPELVEAVRATFRSRGLTVY